MYALMALVFVLGYLCIALEHPLKIDKAASALLTAVLAWTILVLGADSILPLLAPPAPAATPTMWSRNCATTWARFPKSCSSSWVP